MRISLILVLTLLALTASAQNNYYFPAGSQFDTAIPTPEQFMGYPIGEWHTRHDRIVEYFKELARVSPKARISVIGYTNELRPQVILTISSPDNLGRLEAIRAEHVELAKPQQNTAISRQPVIITQGSNVHGNEPSSSEAAILLAYYLVAAQGEEAQRFLREAITHIDPCLNPDGRERHTTWANMHKASPPVADPADREHNEVWPGGRLNHYWFDLNRDWLPLAHVESRNRVQFFQQWLPNVYTDYHEMGTNATNFFEPTKPVGSENPVVPRANYDKLNPLFAKYFVQVLDEMGSLYFSKEQFDNSYPGYGSTYPDIHGGLGLVFEQASSRGHVQRTTTKELTFAFTIRNQLRTSLATMRAAVENRELLLNHQQEFFKTALDEAKKSATKAYVFGDVKDASRTRAFAELMLQHNIDTYPLAADLTIGTRRYERGKAFVVPTEQPQYRMVRSMFEKVTQFYDSVFYDASTWTMALAYGLPHDALTAAIKFSTGEKLKITDLTAQPAAVAKSNYAYLISWSDYAAPKALTYLLQKGVFVKSAFKPFTINTTNGKQVFGYGTLVIAVADQNLSADDLYAHVQVAAKLAGIDVATVSTGYSAEGIDLGSSHARSIQTPKTVMLVGDGVSATEAGAIWFLFDTKAGLPITKVNTTQFGQLRLTDYNTLILVSGNYNMLGEAGANRIRAWVQQGGTLILQKTAVSWAINNKVVDEQLRKEDDSKIVKLDYVKAADYQGSRAIGGSIYAASIDNTHPLGFGFTDRQLHVYRNHSVFIEPSKNPYSTVIAYTAKPHVSGYVHPSNLEKIKNSVSLQVSQSGQGRAILFVDDPAFRGYWYGTNKLLFNAVFLGSNITAPGFGGGEE